MKITKKLLKKLGCCEYGIIKFINTPELHNIDNDIKSIIIKDDKKIFNDFVFFLDKIKKHIVDSIKYEESSGYWKKYTYDDKGNQIKYENSNGYWETFTYDDKGNKIKFEDSNGYWKKYTYDDKGNKIKSETFNGYWEKFTYDMTKIEFI